MPAKKKTVNRWKIENAKNKYGWLPDLPDHRDYLFRALRPVPPTLAPHIDLRHDCSKIEDQGNLGSCTANALVKTGFFRTCAALSSYGE